MSANRKSPLTDPAVELGHVVTSEAKMHESGDVALSVMGPSIVRNGDEEAAGENGNFERDSFSQSAIPEQTFWTKLPRQVTILLKKNFLQLYRNPYSSAFRLGASMYFMLLLYIISAAYDAAEQGQLHKMDVPHPKPDELKGFPNCDSSGCTTLTYVPAPGNKFEPENDELSDSLFDSALTAAQIDEQKRVNQVVRSLMKNNKGGEIKERVLGFKTEKDMDDFMLENLGKVQAGLIFQSPTPEATSFVIEANSSNTQTYLKEVDAKLLPLQLAVSRAISKEMLGKDIEFEFQLQDFAHPEQQHEDPPADRMDEGLFIVCSLIFVFIIQLAEVLVEKEKRFRTYMNTMGLLDSAHWISWHIFHGITTFISCLVLTIWGVIFNFRLFANNNFGVLFFTFWFFTLSMNGLAFCFTAILRTPSQAIMTGVGVFFLGFILSIVGAFGVPFSPWPVKDTTFYMNCTAQSILDKAELDTTVRYPLDHQPFTSSMVYAYEECSSSEIASNPNVTRKIMYNSKAFVPGLMTLYPAVPFIHCLTDLSKMATNTSTWHAYGLEMSNVSSYCKTNLTSGEICDKDYSIGNTWGIMFGLYLMYSVIAIYLDNVLPDPLGVRKPPWYFVLKSYWGLEDATISSSAAQVIEASEDSDVLAEEQLVSQKVGQQMDPNNAIEVRGPRKTFKRNGKDFHAVKCPQFAIQKKKLFALLGHNGAGKTTLFNMLTGVLPPSSGEALVEGHTITHSSGIARLRSMIGVCPQFDVLWENLTAMEHLEIFATLKGLPATSIKHEGGKRLDEVRLTEVADKHAGKFSGGMKRRLSVAISLIGNPNVLFLDEPTTGMDPVSRRHVWDVIETAKQTRAVVLTTHSMEEADILADRLAVIAKGRLRCIGTSVHLKQKFGAGYLVNLACESQSKRDAIKKLFLDMVGAEPTKETKTHLSFNVETKQEEHIPALFQKLESQKTDLEIKDIQLAMSTLEDVFLKISRDAEQAEGGGPSNVPVTLPTGETVMAVAGVEHIQAPTGKQYMLKWGLDDFGNMIAVDTVEMAAAASLQVQVPEGVEGGSAIMVQHEGKSYTVTVPAGLKSGDNFTTQVQVAGGAGPVTASIDGGEYGAQPLSDHELEQRVRSLAPSYGVQAKAVTSKTLHVQKKRYCTNACMCCCPGFTIGIIMLAQWLIETLLLPTGMVYSRCTYCGPTSDEFGKAYCAGQECYEFFWQKKGLDNFDFFDQDRVDMAKDHCKAMSETCGGNGNLSCFWIDASNEDEHKGNYSLGFSCGNFKYDLVQRDYSIYNTIKPLPFIYTPESKHLSDTPVIFSSPDTAKAETLLDKTFKDPFPVSVTTAALSKSLNSLYTLFMLPHLGCGQWNNRTTAETISGLSTITVNLTTPGHESLCKLLQHNQGTNEPCCFDLSMDGVSPPTTEVIGLNTWVAADGSRKYASGVGMQTARDMLAEVFDDGFADIYFLTAKPQFTCYRAQYSAEMASRLPSEDFVSIQMGMAVLQQVFDLDKREYHPQPEANKQIPQCSKEGDCESAQGRWTHTCYWSSNISNIHQWAGQKCGGLTGIDCSIVYYEVLAKALVPNLQQIFSETPHEQRTTVLLAVLNDASNQYPAIIPFVSQLGAAVVFGGEGADQLMSKLESQYPCMCLFNEVVKRYAVAELGVWEDTLISRIVGGLPEYPENVPTASYPDLKPFGFDSKEFGSLLGTPRPYIRHQFYDPEGSLIDFDSSLKWRENFWNNYKGPTRETVWFARDTVTRQTTTLRIEEDGRVSDTRETVVGGSECPQEVMDKEFEDRWEECECFSRDFVLAHPIAGDPPRSQFDQPEQWVPIILPEDGCQNPDDFDYLSKQLPAGMTGFAVLAKNCDNVKGAMGLLQTLGNASEMTVECVSMNKKEAQGRQALDDLIYQGHYIKDNGPSVKGYVASFDFLQISDTKLEVVIMENSSKVTRGEEWDQFIVEQRKDRMFAQVNMLLKAHIEQVSGVYPELMVGMKAFPSSPNWGTGIDIGGAFGPLFIVITFNMLFPDIVTGLVSEKENRIRIMMKMMGLAEYAYLSITFIFWSVFFWVYAMICILLFNTVKLSTSGYQIGMFTQVEGGVQVLFFSIYAVNQISLAFLVANFIGTEKAAQVVSFFWFFTNTLLMLGLGNIGNFFDSEGISDFMKFLVTAFPPLGLWRGLQLWAKYSNKLLYPTLPDVLTLSECKVGTDMGDAFLILGLEIPIFLALALYIDATTDIGFGVSKHPLFCLGFKKTVAQDSGGQDNEDANLPDDVKKEKDRVTSLANAPRAEQDVVVTHGLRKLFPQKNTPKVAVKDLHLGIRRGECFGMLGPNGAGKTTTINMLVGFSQPTAGDAKVEGYSIKSHMDLIYSLMGVCPQHDILWMQLTAQQHLVFYGTLKKLKGAELERSITEALKGVNLLDVRNSLVGTFSGGMKRRLSVAISLIGSPMVTYLDEPSTGLDPASRRLLWNCIAKAKKNSSLLLTTHSMEEAEGLCDRLGIFVDGALACIGEPATLTARYGGTLILTATAPSESTDQMQSLLSSFSTNGRSIYALAETVKYEIPNEDVTLSDLFSRMSAAKRQGVVNSWGVSSCTLEDAFIRIAMSSGAAIDAQN